MNTSGLTQFLFVSVFFLLAFGYVALLIWSSRVIKRRNPKRIETILSGTSSNAQANEALVALAKQETAQHRQSDPILWKFLARASFVLSLLVTVAAIACLLRDFGFF